MPHLFAGFSGITVGLAMLAVIWCLVFFNTKDIIYDFDPQGEKGAFEKLLTVYLRVAEVVVGLAAGSIVLLVGSSAFHQSGRLPWHFASPLFLLALSIIYGILFMVFLITDYEEYRHFPKQPCYNRLKYSRNQTFGYSGLLCFCIGYLWLAVIVTR
jgi:uncharacterized membrane protein